MLSFISPKMLVCLLCFSFSMAFADGLFVQYSLLEPHPLEQALFDATNITRAQNGVASLSYDENLAIAARNHAAEMAQLNYLSHTSPRAATRSLFDRVARAGSPALSVNENLAQIGNNGDVVDKSIQGWLDSPGHRQNMLDPEHTHLGVALAEDATGHVYTVQVFASQPLRIVNSEVEATRKQIYEVVITFSVDELMDVSFFYESGNTRVKRYQAGSYQQVLPLSSGDLSQIRLGRRAPNSNDSFILEDEGWLNPAEGTFDPSGSAPKSKIRMLEVGTREAIQEGYHVTLTFDRAVPANLGVFLAENITQHQQTGDRDISFKLSRPNPEKIELGLQKSNQRFSIIMQLQVGSVNGSPVLLPITPEYSH